MKTSKIIKLDLKQGSYEIIVGNNLLKDCGAVIKKVLPINRTIIITDENVAKLHLTLLQNSLTANNINYETIILPAGEATKSFRQLELLLNDIFNLEPERKITLIAFGGGVIGDITGFAASICLRGINFVQIPTTLLAQVDSSVGGKTGINNDFGKNLIGSFYQPNLVIADTALLSTLPKREFYAGYAEVLKYALIADAEFFDYLDDNSTKIINHDKEVMIKIVTRSCQNKAKIVEQDEKENSIRALLNFGHTFAHALEKETGYSDKLLHGEAVATGMIMAFKLSEKMGFCQQNVAEKVISHYNKIGLNYLAQNIQDSWSIDRLIKHMHHDKKVSDGKMTFILVEDIGKAFIEKDVDEAIVRKTLMETLKIY